MGSYKILNKVGSHDQKIEYLPHDRQGMLPCVKIWFYFTHKFFSSFESIQLKYLQSEKNLIPASQTICDHMFSDTKSDHTFHIFRLCAWFISFSSCMWQFPLTLKIGWFWSLL